jgi:apolipoprotein N-acyltransferase
LLRFVVGLEPVWWLAWVAPALLLALAYRQHHTTTARAVVLTAALIGASVNFSYYAIVMPIGIAVAVTAAQALLWHVAVMTAARGPALPAMVGCWCQHGIFRQTAIWPMA